MRKASLAHAVTENLDRYRVLSLGYRVEQLSDQLVYPGGIKSAEELFVHNLTCYEAKTQKMG